MATGGVNLAEKYAKEIDQRFYPESYLAGALNNDYEFTGAKTIHVTSNAPAAMGDYTRSGSDRYGAPKDVARNVQDLTIARDRAFTTVIDKGDIKQSVTMSAGEWLRMQMREACAPEYDAYGFLKYSGEAVANGNYATTTITDSNAYEVFCNANEALSDHHVPIKGRKAFATNRFANLLMRDPAFSKDTEAAQKMVINGDTGGNVDGIKLIKVPNDLLPAGAAFMVLHPIATCGPRQLEEFKIHENPQGISGALIEGRFIYDFFLLNSKANALWYHGSQAVLKALNIITGASETAKSTILVVPAVKSAAANKWYYLTATTAAGLITPVFGAAITPGDWTAELTASGLEVTPTSSHTVVGVVEVNSSNEPVAYGTAKLNIG